MGHKTSSKSLRLALTHNWESNWHKSLHFADLLNQDGQIRNYFTGIFKKLGVLVYKCQIDRFYNTINITVYVYDILNEKKRLDTKKVKSSIAKICQADKSQNINLTFVEAKTIFQDSNLLGQFLAYRLEKHTSVKKLLFDLKKEFQQLEEKASYNKSPKGHYTDSKVIKGIKITLAGCFQGIEMARKETFQLGQVPLQTLKANIDYAKTTAYTVYGAHGIKVWINYK